MLILVDMKAEAAEREMARRHLAHFVRYRFKREKKPLLWNWHLDYVCEHLEAVTLRQILRLIINIPPRFLKSIVASQCWPAWMIGRENDPRSSMVSASYAADLAFRDSRKTKELVRADWYTDLFPAVDLVKDTEAEWETSGGASRVAAGANGVVTGKGGDHLLGDDLLKPKDAGSEVVRENTNEWIGDTFYSRFNDIKTGTMTHIAQRLHERDPSGYLMELEGNPDADKWTKVILPIEGPSKPTVYHYGRVFHLRRRHELLHEARFGADQVKRYKAMLKTSYEGQYNQRPNKMEGGALRPRMLVRHQRTAEEIVKEWGLIPNIYLDLATKDKEVNKDDPDYNVIEVWARDQLQRLWLLFVWRLQCSMDVMARRLIDVRKKWKPRYIKGEKIGLQHSFRSVLTLQCKIKNIPMLPLLDMDASEDPVQKVIPFEGALNGGTVNIPGNTTWEHDYCAEMRAWPKGRHDDMIVTSGYACNDLDKTPPGDAPGKVDPEWDPGKVTGSQLLAEIEKRDAKKKGKK